MQSAAFSVALPGRWAAPRGVVLAGSRASVCAASSSSWLKHSVRTKRAAGGRATTMMAGGGESSSAEELMQAADFLERVRGINRANEIATTGGKVAALLPLATQDGNPQVRYAAISRLTSLDLPGLSGDDQARLLEAARFVLANDKESSCQSGAADLIAGLKLSDGFDDLVSAFNATSDWMLQFSIASGLGEMGDPRAFDFLVDILDHAADANFLLVAGALGSLGELGDTRALEVVQRFAEHEDQAVRDRATIAIEMLTGKGPAQ